ncbi:S-layer homology domain-containing protein [Paenibacillus cymbidii]|uniref:S-layer homology domain-containing protein n=1 Tax=Paenibacillus cymbidii TaxID=1639034 RepID=UPI001436AA73|nr:S-layer homology domain-containing protein [Paenibacillus cymbidii]
MKEFFFKRMMNVLGFLFFGLLLASGLFTKEAHAADVTFNGSLERGATFNRCDLFSIDENTLRLFDSSALSSCPASGQTFNYFTRDIKPETTGTYTIMVTSAQFTFPPWVTPPLYGYVTGVPVDDDTTMYIYSHFNPAETDTITGLLWANDDTAITASEYSSSNNFRSKIENITLTGGVTYTIVVTSFDADVTGPIEFLVSGAGAVEVMINQYSSDLVATPVANPAGGQVTAGSTVSLSTVTPDADIRYTTDGQDPTSSSTLYSGPISITGEVTIKAIAVKSGMTNSAVMEESYTLPGPVIPAPPLITSPASAAKLATNKPTIAGTTGAGGLVEVFVDNVSAGTTTANGSGQWTLTLTNELTDDVHAVKAKVTVNSQTSNDSNTVNFTVDTKAPAVESVEVPDNGAYKKDDVFTFKVNFDEPVKVTGTPQLGIKIGTDTVQANYVSGNDTSSLTFTYTVLAGQNDIDGIEVKTLGLNGGTIADAAGNDATLTLVDIGDTNQVLVDTTASTVQSVTVPADATYVANAELNFTVNFSENVTVTGTPTMSVKVGDTVRTATYVSASSGTALLFRYTVQAGEEDSNGVEVVGTLALNGGTIQDAAGNNATLTLNGIGNTTGVLVDAIVPTVTSVAVPGNGTYVADQALEFTVNFSENVTVTGEPAFDVTIGTTGRQATYTSGGSGTGSALKFRYTVQSGDLDTDGISVDTLALAGGTIKDSVGNDATLTLNSVASTAAVLVDAVAPTVLSVGVPEDGWYREGQTLDFTVTFDEAVTVSDTEAVTLTVTVGGTEREAAYLSGDGTAALVFRYTVQAGDTDTDGVALGSGIVLAAGETIQDSAGNKAELTLNNVASTANVKVDTQAPKVLSVDVPDAGAYNEGKTLSFTVHFDENVQVTGTPTLGLTIGTMPRTAAYASGNGTAALTLTYTVLAGETDTDGVTVGTLSASGGNAIKDLAGNDATLTLVDISDMNQVLVDTTAPMVQSVTVPADATYVANAELNFTVNFSENVTVTGTPTMSVKVGDTVRTATYVSASSGTALLFRYTVQAGEEDSNGVEVVGTLALNGGTIQDAAGNNATLTLNGIGNTTGVLVDAIVPTVTSVAVPGNGTYVADQALEFTVNFSENVTVTGEPALVVTIGTTVRQATYTSGGSGTGSALKFRYTLQSGDLDTNGISVGTLALAGGTIKDSVGNDATLTLNSVASTSAVLVDAVAPTVLSVGVPEDGWYREGQTLDFTVTFDEVVTVSGTPTLGLVFQSTVRNSVYAAYESGSGTSTLTFRLTVQEGDLDADGIALGLLSLENGAAAIRDAVSNDAVLGLTGADTSGIKIDAVKPDAGNVTVVTGTYGVGEHVDLVVTFPEIVYVQTTGGTPYVNLTIGSSVVQTVYVSGTGTKELLFRYTVQLGNLDLDGIAAGTTIVLNEGTIRDAAGNDSITTLPAALGADRTFVDTRAAAPTIELSFTGWTNQTVTAAIYGNDDNALQYRIGPTGGWNPYSGPVSIDEEGVEVVYARQVDAGSVAGHEAQAIVRIDKTAPVLLLNGSSVMSIYVGSDFSDPSYTVSDMYDESPNVDVSGEVNAAVIGSYAITYAATDAAGNQSQPLVRTVNVIAQPIEENTSSPPTPIVVNKEKLRQVPVEVGSGDGASRALTVDIVRKGQEGGIQVDEVVLRRDKMDEAVQKAQQENKSTVRIVIDDLPDDPADEVSVKLPKDTHDSLTAGAMDLEVKTEGATLTLPRESLADWQSGGDDLYFRIVPVRAQETRTQVEERTVTAAEVRVVAGDNSIAFVGTPMTIETNFQNRPVKVAFPLDPKSVPTDPAARERFIASLAVYVEHSDGDKELKRGTIRYDADGNPVAIEIGIDKFSTFVIITAEAKQAEHPAYVFGYPDGTFRPNNPITRAEAATILSRLLQPERADRGLVAAYTDVDSGYWAFEAIRTAGAAGLMVGDGGRFRPDETITRAELAVVALRWKQQDVRSDFGSAMSDIRGHWAQAAIETAVHSGWMRGYEDGSFGPDRTLTRAEMVTTMNRLLGRDTLHLSNAKPTWQDVPSDYWAYEAIEEASRTHTVVAAQSGNNP